MHGGDERESVGGVNREWVAETVVVRERGRRVMRQGGIQADGSMYEREWTMENWGTGKLFGYRGGGALVVGRKQGW